MPIEPRFHHIWKKWLIYRHIKNSEYNICLRSLLNTEKINSLFKHKFDNMSQCYIIDSNLSIIKHMDKSNQIKSFAIN